MNFNLVFTFLSLVCTELLPFLDTPGNGFLHSIVVVTQRLRDGPPVVTCEGKHGDVRIKITAHIQQLTRRE